LLANNCSAAIGLLPRETAAVNSPGPPQKNQSESDYQSPAAVEFPTQNGSEDKPLYVVGIGASAGGLEALERFFQHLPHDTGMAFIVVQHLSPDFKSLMGEVLSRWTSLPIRSVEDQMPVSANTIFLMPPRTEMIISDGRLLLTAREKSEELRLPIDQFFRSLARDAGRRSIAIILSGTGSDGSRGIRDIAEAGGLVIAQTPETCKFDGMPISAMETGVVQEILAPEEIPRTISRFVASPPTQTADESEQTGMAPVFQLLRNAFGIDFSYYKPSTVARRTEHRMQLKRIADLDDYVALVRENRDELDSLYRDLLVGVTSFFRDPDGFALLESQVIPALLHNHASDQEVRVWVAGCATGEEAYSMAILLDEQIRKSGCKLQARVFATDVHPSCLDFAATGIYSRDSVSTVNTERLTKYFVPTKDGFRVTTDLRNMVVFARHNIIKDAPFTHMDMISCRNLLIYLIPSAQNKALSLFHFGLKTGGILFLGPSESPGDLSGEFQPLDSHWKIYKKRRDIKLSLDLRNPLADSLIARMPQRIPARDTGISDILSQVLESTLPASVLINSEFEIVHSFGDTSDYLRLRRGHPSLSLLDMLGDDLRMAVGAALHRSARSRKEVTFNNVRASQKPEGPLVNVTIIPMAANRRNGTHFLVSFEKSVRPVAPERQAAEDLNLSDAARDHIHNLEAELQFTRENLQATIEELETSNEELQATNEELLASNEELQSTNEELHSVNEELYTVNAEYQKKISELTELTHDMDNLLSSTDVHTIFLDEQLRIRRFTPKMAEVFNLIDSDVGRRIHGFMHSIQCEDLSDKLSDVLENRRQYEEEVQNEDGETYLMRILPYRGDPNQAGVVMTLVNITVLKDAETRFSSAMEVAPNGMLMVCNRGLITQANSELARIFGYEPQELIGQPLEILIANEFREDHRDYRKDYFRKPYVLRRMGSLPYVWGQHKHGHRIPMDVHVRPINTPHGRQAIASVVDVSRHQQLEESLREQVEQRDRFLATLSHELRNPMGAILSAVSLLSELASHSESLQKPCSVIGRQAAQMSLLMDDLLDVARVTQGKITLRKEIIDLVIACKDSIEAVQPLLNHHKHRLITQYGSETVFIEADRVRILQIIENLLTNAIKYTNDGGLIRINLTTDRENAHLQVIDNGRGIPAKYITSIFDMFVQSDDTLDRSEGGMGVGLTLVRALIEMHQGTITAASDGPGMGSTFSVILPLANSKPFKDPDSQILPSEGVRRSIVFVEDEKDAREMMAALLEHRGHNVLATADNGADGLREVLKLQPEVAILDIGLPQMDGYQLAKRIRQELGDSVYLIALTGYGRGEDLEKVLHAGFDRHLVKPVMIQHLDQLLVNMPKNVDPPPQNIQKP
jgi:two-component system CheB/CheR fusion protein